MTIVLFPAYIFLGRGSLDGGNPSLSIAYIASILFYLQLFIESVVASVRLKHANKLTRYIASVAAIVASPLLLIGGLIGSEYTGTNTPFLASFGTIAAIQIAASILIWRVILTPKTQD